MKTVISLAVALVAQAAGDTCLSRAMKLVAARLPAETGFSPVVLLRGLESPLVWIGILLLLVFLGLFLSVLSREDLSFVLPILAFGYVLNVASARVFLGEPVSAVRWAGTILVVLGVGLVSWTKGGTAGATANGATAEGGVADPNDRELPGGSPW